MSRQSRCNLPTRLPSGRSKVGGGAPPVACPLPKANSATFQSPPSCRSLVGTRRLGRRTGPCALPFECAVKCCKQQPADNASTRGRQQSDQTPCESGRRRRLPVARPTTFRADAHAVRLSNRARSARRPTLPEGSTRIKSMGMSASLIQGQPMFAPVLASAKESDFPANLRPDQAANLRRPARRRRSWLRGGPRPP
jgi:hypothetical protein